MKSNLKILVVLTFYSQVMALADTCPPPPSSVDPSVSTAVSYDRKSGFYTYRYSLQSSQSSQIPLDFFILQIAQAPLNIQSPPHWIPGLNTSPMMPVHFDWDSSGRSTDLQPGQRLTGFIFQSTQPPGLVQFNAEGRADVPSSSPPAEGALYDEPEPNCPDWDFNNPRFKTIISGITTGPLAANTVSVAIRLREGTSARPAAPINPANPTSQLGVLVFASKTFDPSQIVFSSIKFGPGEAAPISSKLIPASDGDDRDADREEWERLSRGLGDDHEHDLDKDPKRQNLLLIFDRASLDVQCVLDKAVFLTGKTQAGLNIFGGASTRLIGCDIRHPGKHRRKTDAKKLESELKRLRRIQRANGGK